MSPFCCPICRKPLCDIGNSLRCDNGHCYDKARSGYVNLLRSQQSHAKRHGDDKRMLVARRTFLDRGYYQSLCNLLCEVIGEQCPENGLLLDAGCGEGYYTAAIARANPSLRVCGIDISKDALQMCAARTKDVPIAVASVFSLPLRDNAADAVLSVFAPCCDAEFARVTKRGGKLIRVVPTANHLYGLKAAIYKQARPNKPEKTEVEGFTLCKRRELAGNLTLNNTDDIRSLFEMTPYYYKTGKDDQQRLLSRSNLQTEIGFAVLVYEKN